MKIFKCYYGDLNSKAIELELSEDMLVVRTNAQQKIGKPVKSLSANQALSDFNLVLSFPESGVSVYKSKIDNYEVRDRASKHLKPLNEIRFSGRALQHPYSKSPIIYTENLYLKFNKQESAVFCKKFIKDHGLKVIRNMPYAVNAYFVSAQNSGLEIFSIANNLLESEHVNICHPELISKREFKSDVGFQWHLGKTTIDGNEIEASANVVDAWNISTGWGVTIAIIDDGVDIDHEEFSQENKIVAPFDATLGGTDPRPKYLYVNNSSSDNHGTCCAGVACANGFFNAAGVAPDAYLMPIRLSSNLGSMDEADAIYHAVDNGADVISCSWGPPDGIYNNEKDPLHQSDWPIPASTSDAIDYAINNGRNGLGCIIVWAAGNGRESVELDGYASYHSILAIAASNDRNCRSVYSDYGNSVFCCFPSNDFEDSGLGQKQPLTDGIWTTDVTGIYGYNSGVKYTPANKIHGDDYGDYTSSFGGTSSSAPGVAGLVALLLSIEPDLTWEEVRERLKKSCEKLDIENGDYSESGHSIYYGYGKPNAVKLLK